MPLSFPFRPNLLSIAKWALITIGVVAAIWIVVILWWQSSQRQITPGDALTYLVALPAAALLTIVGIQWIRKRKRAPASAPGPVDAPVSGAEQPEMGAPAANGLPILAAWSFTSIGASLDEYRQALIDKRQRPIPDAAMLDDYGFPLHTARIPELDISTVQDDLKAVISRNAGLAQSQDDMDREGFLRTLALLSQLLAQLNAEWPLADDVPDSSASLQGSATLRGREPVGAITDMRLQLQVKMILPSSFTSAEQQLALSYLLENAAALPVDSQRLHVQILPAADDPIALQLAERFRAEALESEQPQALLLLACESALCPVVAERWQAESKLFGSHAPHGQMPGEAAFAILCANRQALPLAVDAPACMLQRVVHARREHSADNGGKPAHATLAAVVADALAAAGVAGDVIGTVACDADHRSSRVLECIGAMLEHTPQLDAIENRLSVNEACGHTGAASNAGGWAAGIAQVREAGCPVLLFNVSHAFERAAAVLLPTNERPQPS